MLKIRLRRMGSRHKPFYRLVVSDGRRTPTGTAIEELGHYDPRNKPPVFKVDLERVDHWLSVGAQTSGTVKNLIRDARVGRGASSAPAEVEAAAEAEAKTEAADTPAEAKPAEAEPAEATSDEAAEAKASDDSAEAPAEASDDAAAEASKEGEA